MTQNETVAAQNDDTFGGAITWESEDVAIVYGDNQSDKRVVNTAAQIAVMADVDLWRAQFGDAYILASSNGTSLRVACQRIGRKFNGKDIPANRRAVIDHIRGIRVRGSTTKTVRDLPDGTKYDGTNEVEYRQLYGAALVDAGVDGNIAQNIARQLTW